MIFCFYLFLITVSSIYINITVGIRREKKKNVIKPRMYKKITEKFKHRKSTHQKKIENYNNTKSTLNVERKGLKVSLHVEGEMITA